MMAFVRDRLLGKKVGCVLFGVFLSLSHIGRGGLSLRFVCLSLPPSPPPPLSLSPSLSRNILPAWSYIHAREKEKDLGGGGGGWADYIN